MKSDGKLRKKQKESCDFLLATVKKTTSADFCLPKFKRKGFSVKSCGSYSLTITK